MSLPSRRRPDRQPGRWARVLAPAVVRAADGLSRWITRVLRVEPTVGREDITEAQLRELIAVNTALDPEERRVVGKALTRATAPVREVLVPRTEVQFLTGTMTVADALATARVAGHSRYPVIDADHDDVLGFVHLRDVVWHPDPGEPVAMLVREIHRLPASKPVLAALSEMRRERHQIAVVVDEYGGTAGIVTLEDLIEELVGEIHDEYDLAPVWSPRGDGVVEIDGRLNLADFTERTGLVLPDGPYETVGGFLMSGLGRVPAVGDGVQVEAYTLVVLAVDGRRVDRVGLLPGARPQPGPEGAAAADGDREATVHGSLPGWNNDGHV